MKVQITKRQVDSIPTPTEGRVKVYDASLTGFGLVVYASGKRMFFVEYGPATRRRRLTLGAYGPLTVDAARKLAAERLGEVIHGEDPLDQREARRRMPTFGEWVDTYMEGVRRRKKRPEHDAGYLGRGRERWGSRPLDAITRRDVGTAMEAEAARGNPTANRWLASVRACFAAAVRDVVIEANPAMGVRPYREGPPRSRVLTDVELERVVAAVEELENPHVRAAFVLLVETGARKSEVLRAKWADLDLDDSAAGLWRLPSPKAGRPQVIPLAPGTVAYLRTVPRVGDWLVPGQDTERHRSDLRTAWNRIRAVAELVDVTIHDVRRTFGLAVARMAGLHVASKLLRHSDVRITERVYAPLGIADLRTAVTGVYDGRAKVIDIQKAKAGRGV